MDDVRAGQPGSPGEAGTSDHAGQGGKGGAGGAGGAGDPGGAGGGGGSGGPFIGNRGRRRISTGSFVILVIMLPLWAGMAWMQHQHTVLQGESERHQVLDDWRLYDNAIASCARVNSLRERQNTVVAWIGKQDSDFPLRAEKIVVCTNVILKPSTPRPT